MAAKFDCRENCRTAFETVKDNLNRGEICSLLLFQLEKFHFLSLTSFKAFNLIIMSILR